MSKYLGKYRGPGYTHPQFTCHFGQCPNIRAKKGDQDTGTQSPPATATNVQISGQIQGTRTQAPTVHRPMSKYPGIYRGPGYRHPQSTCYCGQCPNIRANTEDQDTGTHSPPAIVTNVKISWQIQGIMIQAPTVYLLLWPKSKYPGKYREPGYRH